VFPAGIVAIILGHIARRQIRRTGEGGRSLATAGLILGYIGLLLTVGLALALGVILAVSTGSSTQIHPPNPAP
jgi:Domain of unknown function (DUF4190)